MENQIFDAKSTFYQSIVLRENELWLSVYKVKSLEKFEKASEKTGMMQSVKKMPLSNIKEIKYNEASESMQLIHTNEKGKEKKIKFEFENESESNYFAESLARKLNFTRLEEKENQIKPLLLNVFYLLITIGGTFLLSTMDEPNILENGSSRKNRGNEVLLQMIVDTVGQTGVIIIGGLISAYLIYQLYNRYQNPASDVVLRR